MNDFAALVGFPSFRPFSGRKSKNSRGPGNGFRDRSEHCEMDDSAAFVGFPSFRQLSAAGNAENPKGPANGFRKRSEHCEMDEFAAFVRFPSFRQLSAAAWKWLGKEANIGKWTILLLLWGSPHFGSFRRPESRKSRGPWKWLPEKERKLRNERFCCFCGVPLISAAFGGRKSRKSKGPWKWLPEKERILRNERCCCFCGVRQLSAAGNPENLKSPGNGFRKRSEHWEIDDFAAFVGFPSFRQLSAA